MYQLTVFFNKTKIGILKLLPQSEDFSFEYDELWKQN